MQLLKKNRGMPFTNSSNYNILQDYVCIEFWYIIEYIRWIIKKKPESSRKTSTSTLLTMPKPLTVWITTNCGKFLKRWEYQTTWPTSWEICMQVRKQQLELDVEQQTGSK